MNARLLGIVLCGGRSSRMGRDKAMLPHPSGGTFLGHAISRLVPLCEEVVICGDVVIEGHVSISDPVAFHGPVVGIVAGLQHASRHEFDACLLTPVDVPSLRQEDLATLKTSWSTTGATTVAFSDRIEPLVGIYNVSDLAALQSLAAGGDRSLYRFFLRQ